MALISILVSRCIYIGTITIYKQHVAQSKHMYLLLSADFQLFYLYQKTKFKQVDSIKMPRIQVITYSNR